MRDKTLTDADIDERYAAQNILRPVPSQNKIDPLPLSADLPSPNPFPIQALGEYISPLVQEMHRIIKSPIPICAQSILGNISLVSQPHIDVFINGRVFPISLFFFTVAKSGERKTAIDNIASKPINLHEEYKQAAYKKELERYESEREQNLSLPKKNRINLIKPREQTIIMSEPTFEGMIKLFDEGQPSMGLFSDEGGRFIHGHGMNDDNRIKTSTGISSLWDGSYISSVRVGSGNKKLYGRRLSFHLMIQPKIAQSVFSDNALIDQGFLGRCLLSWPTTMMGNREYIDENIFTNPHYLSYADRIKTLLNQSIRFKEHDLFALNPRQITLTKEAFKLFIEFYNEVESQLAIKGKYHDIASFANKAPEHACRIAACLTFYHDIKATEISAYFMMNAITLMQYYLTETHRLLCNSELNLTHASQREVSLHAQGLLDWLIEKHKEAKYFENDVISLRDIMRLAPYRYRDKETCHFLVKQLVDAGWLLPNDQRKTYKLIFVQ